MGIDRWNLCSDTEAALKNGSTVEMNMSDYGMMKKGKETNRYFQVD